MATSPQAKTEVGLNLNGPWMRDMANTPSLFADSPLSFFEVIADNFFEPTANTTVLHTLAEKNPVHLHSVGMNIGGFDPICVEYIAKIKTLVDIINPRVVSDHLCVQAHNGIYVHDLLPFPWNQGSFERVASRIDQIQQSLGRQLAVENLSQYVFFEKSKWTEAEFLQKLCSQTGCGLLVDLNNLVVNEKNYSIDAQSQLSILKECPVLEAHVAGSEKLDNLWVDTHGSDVEPRTLELLNVLQKGRDLPVPVVYERDTNITTIQEAFEQCRRIQSSMDKCFGESS